GLKSSLNGVHLRIRHILKVTSYRTDDALWPFPRECQLVFEKSLTEGDAYSSSRSTESEICMAPAVKTSPSFSPGSAVVGTGEGAGNISCYSRETVDSTPTCPTACYFQDMVNPQVN